ncbi:MAG: RHS repeat protein [Anaerolineae bacterium]|nr:RHS repeat protein [Anaerolineae bacterium]
MTQADGTTVKSFYQNRQTAVLDALNRQTISETDAVGRLYRVQQYLVTVNGQPDWGATVYAHSIYTYTVSDQLEQMTGPDEALTTMTYDLLGRKTRMTDPDMGIWSYTYDAAGNLTRQTDARGCVITFSYDGLNRVKGKTYSGSSGCSATAVGYTYDSGTTGKGRRTGMSDSSGSASWTYDGRGRVTQESKAINGTGGGTFVTQWSYDSADRPLWMKYPGGASQIGEQVHYAYTTQGLLDTVRSNGSTYYVGKTQYNERGQVMERWLGSTTGVVKQLYAYSVAENFRLVSLKAGTGATNDNRQKISYTYDDAGNVLTITDAAAYGCRQTQKFTYDTLDRLSTASRRAAPTAHG